MLLSYSVFLLVFCVLFLPLPIDLPTLFCLPSLHVFSLFLGPTYLHVASLASPLHNVCQFAVSLLFVNPLLIMITFDSPVVILWDTNLQGLSCSRLARYLFTNSSIYWFSFLCSAINIAEFKTTILKFCFFYFACFFLAFNVSINN